MTNETSTPAWPPASAVPAAPYTPAPATADKEHNSEETANVENIRYDKVTATGAPVNPTTPQDAQHQALSSSNGTDPSGYSASNYAELIEQLEQRMAAIRPLSKEDLEKTRRKQRAEGIIAGIADASQAISNLFFTSQYAPNMYNAGDGMSAKARERFARAKAERNAEDDLYMNYALQLGRARDAVDTRRGKERQQDIALQLKVNEDARRQAKAEHDAEMADIDLQIRMGRLDYEGARARKAAAEARLAEAYAEHADERVMSEINRNNRANRGGNRGGNSSTGQFTIKRINPETGEIEYRSGFKSESAARNHAQTYKDQGWVYETTPVTTQNSVTRTDMQGLQSKSETTTRRDVSSPQNNEPWSLDD